VNISQLKLTREKFDNNNNYDAKVGLKSFNVGNNIMYTINCNYRIAAKIHTLEKRFVSST